MKPDRTPHITRFQKYLYTLLMIVLCTLMVLNFVVPDQLRSEVENRPLANFPAVTLESLSSGKFAKQFNDYMSDQFLGRNSLFHVDYLFRKLCGQREIDDVFLGKNALLQNPSKPKDGFPSSQVDAINAFADLTGLPTAVLVAPSAASIQPDKLPLDAPVNEENSALDTVYNSLATSKADVRQVLTSHQNEYIYYRTDHHWTSLGAKYGAQTLLESFGVTMNPDDFDSLKVSDTFEGTLANKTGAVGLQDDISICPDKYQTEYVVTWNDGSKTASIYNQDALNHKDQYQVFLGANQGLIHIETLSNSNENLLLFKDSYANSMIQFLLPYYRNIYIVDPRYFYDDIGFVMAAGNITQLAFVFSYNNFMTDPSLRDVLETQIAQAQAQDQPAAQAAQEESAQEQPSEQESPSSQASTQEKSDGSEQSSEQSSQSEQPQSEDQSAQQEQPSEAEPSEAEPSEDNVQETQPAADQSNTSSENEAEKDSSSAENKNS